MKILKENNRRTKLITLQRKPEKVEYCSGKYTRLHTSAGIVNAACLRCNQPQCIYIDKEKIKCIKLKDFPGETDNKVCPVDAINWDKDEELPKINQDKCIKCGLCARFCPIGAIHFNNMQYLINDEHTVESYKEVAYNKENIKLQEKILSLMDNIPREGRLLGEENSILEEIYNSTIRSKLVPEKFVRNLLISLGLECITRRIGDVYTRMDAVYTASSGTFGAIEVEFGSDTLEAARAILDDIAVLHSRYNIHKQDNTALVVCLSLPTLRQGYWQVIKDIKNIQGIRINTITLGVLLILSWNFCRLDLRGSTYYADYDDATIRTCLERDLKREVAISDKYLGILESVK